MEVKLKSSQPQEDKTGRHPAAVGDHAVKHPEQQRCRGHPDHLCPTLCIRQELGTADAGQSLVHFTAMTEVDSGLTDSPSPFLKDMYSGQPAH